MRRYQSNPILGVFLSWGVASRPPAELPLTKRNCLFFLPNRSFRSHLHGQGFPPDSTGLPEAVSANENPPIAPRRQVCNWRPWLYSGSSAHSSPLWPPRFEIARRCRENFFAIDLIVKFTYEQSIPVQVQGRLPEASCRRGAGAAPASDGGRNLVLGQPRRALRPGPVRPRSKA